MDSLNRAFEKAFAHTSSKETLLELLECIGTELECDRIAIFENGHDGTCDNTYEWCREGTVPVRELYQHVAVDDFDSWIERMKNQEFLRIRDIGAVKEEDPDVYLMMHAQHVNSVIASRLAFHGRTIGFFLLENPGEEILNDAPSVMPGMRYIISSLVYSDHLVRKLKKIGYADQLTGLSNRTGLMEQLEQCDPSSPIGVVYCEIVGWSKEEQVPGRIRVEQALIRSGEILSGLFGADRVFHLAPGEMLALSEDVDRDSFRHSVTILQNLFREHDLLVSVGTVYKEKWTDQFDSLVRQAHMDAHNGITGLVMSRTEKLQAAEEEFFGEGDVADISMYRNDDFFKHASDYLNQIFEEQVMMIVVDLNYFKLYNDIFGRRAGNILLENIADGILREARRTGGIAGYLGGDNFCLVVPVKGHTEESLRPLIDEIIDDLKYPDGFAPALGIYLSEDRQESLVAMYDHALTALAEIKGSYIEHYRFYDADHFRRDRDTKLLLMDVKRGLPEGEFIFYLQPQVLDRTGRIVGAEALVRWQCKGQLLAPTQFIPALEKSGYIYAVDCYIWEEVVKWLSSVSARGIIPVPVSVNVSRVDFYFDDIAEHFIELTRRYGVDPSMLGIEITESAFTDNTETILKAVTTLHEAGFSVLMDDFGSGSSSLSMLHTMNLDVLKTDVRFMSRKDSDSKAISIVESVVSMAHMIGMVVITEGVETEQQKENLIAIGDNYAQGFYFYRPMPVEQFEELLSDKDKIGTPLKSRETTAENHLKFRELIREGMLSDTLLDNLIGAAAVYKLENSTLSILQMNAQYEEIVGARDDDQLSKDSFTTRLIENNRGEIRHLISEADQHPYEGVLGVIRIGTAEGLKEMSSRVFPLYRCTSHALYFATLEETGS